MVRHEVRVIDCYYTPFLCSLRAIQAAEAMGAISAASSIPILKRYVNDSNRSVRETCEIALDKIEWDLSEEGQKHRRAVEEAESQCVCRFLPHCAHPHEAYRTYTSIDPAPPTSGLLTEQPSPSDVSDAKINELREQLLDTKLPLFQRYRAMFALRNIGTPAAVDALAAGFSDDSALFKYEFSTLYALHDTHLFPRHEIAFVFGQLLSTHSVPALLKVLEDNQESEMVRHEAAEALGGIATPEVLPHLKEWMHREDAPRVVRESCQVALDMYEVRYPPPSRRPITLNPCLRSMRTLASSSTQTASTLLPPPRRLARDQSQAAKNNLRFPDPSSSGNLCYHRHCSLGHLYPVLIRFLYTYPHGHESRGAVRSLGSCNLRGSATIGFAAPSQATRCTAALTAIRRTPASPSCRQRVCCTLSMPRFVNARAVRKSFPPVSYQYFRCGHDANGGNGSATCNSECQSILGPHGPMVFDAKRGVCTSSKVLGRDLPTARIWIVA